MDWTRRHRWTLTAALLLGLAGCGGGGGQPAAPGAESAADNTQSVVGAPIIGGNFTSSAPVPTQASATSPEPASPTAASRAIAPRVMDLSDPAMQPAESELAEESAAPEVLPDNGDTLFAIDKDNGRIFVAGAGWYSADELMQMYYERSELLPAEPDVEIMNQVRSLIGTTSE